VDSTTANKYLHVLRELRLVERTIPLTDPDPLRSRRGTYRIADRFVTFHFRHLQPNLSLVTAGRGSRVLEEYVQPDFEHLYDEARTEFLLDHLRRDAAELLGEEIVETGRHAGGWIRALGRTAGGRGVAAITLEPPRPAAGSLGRELANLEEVLGSEPALLRYTVTDDPSCPLDVHLATTEELLR